MQIVIMDTHNTLKTWSYMNWFSTFINENSTRVNLSNKKNMV